MGWDKYADRHINTMTRAGLRAGPSEILNDSSFSRNKPIIWKTFGALFAKVIDMTRLYILIIFDIEKDSQIYLKLIWTFQEKRQRAYKIYGS